MKRQTDPYGKAMRSEVNKRVKPNIYIFLFLLFFFLEFHLCSFISFFHWFQFICVMYSIKKVLAPSSGLCEL